MLHAFISPSEMRPVLRAHCWGVRDRLPKIAIPLAEPGRHITSDLQQVWNTAYDRGGFPPAVDYSQELPWKFAESDREWIRQHAAAGAKR